MGKLDGDKPGKLVILMLSVLPLCLDGRLQIPLLCNFLSLSLPGGGRATHSTSPVLCFWPLSHDDLPTSPIIVDFKF